MLIFFKSLALKSPEFFSGRFLLNYVLIPVWVLLGNLPGTGVLAAEHAVKNAAESVTKTSPGIIQPQRFEKPNLSQLLAGMGSALNSGNYTMSMVYIHDNQIDTLRFSHLTTPTDRFDKLEHLQGSQRMVISQNGDTYLVMGKEQIHLARDEGSPVSRWRRQLEKLAKNIHHYAIGISGLNRIAGRPAFELDFSAVNPDRYSTRLWLDAITYLPLRMDTLDKNNRIIEQILAIDLQFPANLSEANFLIDKDLVKVTQAVLPASSNGHSTAWKIGWLPAGYELTVHHQNILANGLPSEQWVYSDGLTSLSVFIEQKSTRKNSGNVHSDQSVKNIPGKQRAFIRGDTLIFDTERSKIRITVVGDIPYKIAEKIAQSVRASDKTRVTLK